MGALSAGWDRRFRTGPMLRAGPPLHADSHQSEGAPSEQRVIVTRLMGGLGNQMFQYAAGRALALRTGAMLKLDISYYDTHRDRRYALGCFRIEAARARERDLVPFGLAGRRWPGRLEGIERRLRARLASKRFPIRRERGFRFDPAVVRLQGFVYLEGYWQSEKYFQDQAAVLQREFEPVEPFDPANVRLAADIDAVNAVSVHVRRGDFAGVGATNRYHGMCSVDYYRAAVAYVAAKTPAPQFFVFSDEPEWVRAHLELGVPASVIDINSPDQGYRDMQLMARCRHHITANSSFSWWGAWLGRAPEKIVVCPKRWFNIAAVDTSDLLPDSWIRL
jgi:hypothetical protein